MAKVISIHEYDLKPGAVEADFERAILEAERRGLFALPGLVGHHFLKGIKGGSKGRVYRCLDIRKPRSMGEALG